MSVKAQKFELTVELLGQHCRRVTVQAVTGRWRFPSEGQEGGSQLVAEAFASVEVAQNGEPLRVKHALQ